MKPDLFYVCGFIVAPPPVKLKAHTKCRDINPGAV